MIRTVSGEPVGQDCGRDWVIPPTAGVYGWNVDGPRALRDGATHLRAKHATRAARRLDLAAAPELQGFLDELVAGGFDRVVIDLRELTFMDSTGMNFIYRLDRWGRDAGRTLVFTRPIAGVLVKLQIASLAHQLRFVEPDSVDAKAD